MLEGSDLLIEQKGYLFSSIFIFRGGSAYSTYAFGRGLPQKRTKAYKGGGGGVKIAEFRAYVLFEWPHCKVFVRTYLSTWLYENKDQ